LVVAYAVVAGLCLPACADDQGRKILSRTLYAAFGVDYSGTRQIDIYRDGAKVQTYQQTVYHGRGNKQRIVLDGSSQMIVSDGHTMWEYYPVATPPRVVVRHLPSAQEALNHRLEGLQRTAASLGLAYEGDATVAGRHTNVVMVTSSDGTLVKRVWVDAQRGIEMGTERYDRSGRIKFSSYLISVSFSPHFPDGAFSFTPPEGVTVVEAPTRRQRMTLAQAEQETGFAGIVPSYLPAGYTFDDRGVSVTEQQGMKVLWLAFSNGIDTFSLFESGIPPQLPGQIPHRVTVWTQDTYLFMLVGRLPAGEVKRIKASMRR
jgi:outer membrane lipoprotein-sorting protein